MAKNALQALVALAADDQSPPALRQRAVLAPARFHRFEAVALIAEVTANPLDVESSRRFWQQALSRQLAAAFTSNVS